jgi:DNA modification methylase
MQHGQPTTDNEQMTFDDGDESEALLQLDKPQLLETLQLLCALGSVESLRQEVARFKDDIQSPDSSLFSPADETVTLPLDYIIESLDQIAAAQTIDRARYYVERFIKGVTDVRTSAINDINLNRWKTYDDILTDSLWTIDRRDSSGVHTAGYWGNFIPQIPNQMIRRYTKPGDWVLDTFAGCGTTLIEAQRWGRHSIGVELNPAVADRARELLGAEPNTHNVVREIVTGDSATLDIPGILQQHNRRSVQLVMMHPPYFDIIKFSDDPRDLSKAASTDAFLALLGQVAENAAAALDPGRYLVLVIGDKYVKGEWIPLGFQAMNVVQERGFTLKSIVVKNFEETTGKRNQKELWRYRALVGGFYVFKHEYIFVFKKRGG